MTEGNHQSRRLVIVFACKKNQEGYIAGTGNCPLIG